jgi:hypothetical protein
MRPLVSDSGKIKPLDLSCTEYHETSKVGSITRRDKRTLDTENTRVNSNGMAAHEPSRRSHCLLTTLVCCTVNQVHNRLNNSALSHQSEPELVIRRWGKHYSYSTMHGYGMHHTKMVRTCIAVSILRRILLLKFIILSS